MPTNYILTYEERQNTLNYAYKQISKTKKRLQEIEQFYNTFNFELPMSSFANFRDALFHYVKIYEYSDFVTVVGNVYSLDEHLQRAIKDSVLELLNKIVDWLVFFCINHELNELIVKEIDSNFENFKDIDRWNLKFFYYVSKHLEKSSLLKSPNTYFKSEELRIECLKYCADIVQDQDLQCAFELKKYMHYFKNQTLEIRSASSILIKTYEDGEEWNQLVSKLKEFYEYMQKKKLHFTSFFKFYKIV